MSFIAVMCHGSGSLNGYIAWNNVCVLLSVYRYKYMYLIRLFATEVKITNYRYEANLCTLDIIKHYNDFMMT